MQLTTYVAQIVKPLVNALKLASEKKGAEDVLIKAKTNLECFQARLMIESRDS